MNSSIDQLEFIAVGQEQLKDGHGTAVTALLALTALN
jgi:hypothetical protein